VDANSLVFGARTAIDPFSCNIEFGGSFTWA
jgi:hypothetical protein